MPSITVKDNIEEFTRNLDKFQKRQIPFATSKAMNDTAIKVQEAEVKRVQISFNNKKKWWAKGNRRTGIRVDFSNKKNMPLKASVYTNAYFAKLQEDGGTKRPISGSSLAIPTAKAPKSIRRSDGLNKVKGRSNVFISKRGVFQRMRKGKVKTLFTWSKTANISPSFKWELTANVATKRWMPIHFKKRLKQAINSAKL